MNEGQQGQEVDLRRVTFEAAAEAHATVRSVQKVLRGESVRGDVGERIRRALRRRGVAFP